MPVGMMSAIHEKIRSEEHRKREIVEKQIT